MTVKTAYTMIEQSIREYLLPEQFNAAVRAGAAIMKIYKNSDDYDISLKSDHTPITIKKGAYVGMRANILSGKNGITIGENAMIGAGSVVTKDVPAGELWVGNPAKFLRKLD